MKFIRLIALVIGIVCPAASQAGYIFEVDPVSVVEGQTVSTNLYVKATSPDVPNFSTLLGVSFNLSGTGGTASIASWTKNPLLFNGVSATPSGASLNQGPLSGFVTPTSGRALLGSVSFQGLSVGATNFSFTDPNAGAFDNVVIQTPTGVIPIDSQVFSSASNFSVNVTAVPEPSSMALLGLAGAGLAAARRFRRKKSV